MPLPDNSGQNSPEFIKLSNGISGDFSGAKCQTWVNKEPTGPWLMLGVVALIAIPALAAVLFFRRRRQRKGNEGTGDEEREGE